MLPVSHDEHFSNEFLHFLQNNESTNAGKVVSSIVASCSVAGGKQKHASKNNKRLLKLPSFLHAVYELLHICIEVIAGNGLIFAAYTSC
jgi:hypothetical protein